MSDKTTTTYSVALAEKPEMDLDKYLDDIIDRKLTAVAEKLNADVSKWIEEQNEEQRKRDVRAAADRIAQQKHMRVVEEYLELFKGLIGQRQSAAADGGEVGT